MPSNSLALPLAAALGLALSVGGCDRQSSADSQPPAAPAGENAAGEGELTGTLARENAGSALPDFTFSDPSGASLHLPELKGTPVLLNLWATWCAPCVVEMPMLDALAGEYDGRLRVITISQDMKGAEKVAPFFAERQFKHLPAWLDPMNDLAFHYGGDLPTTVLYDADGKEVWRMVGGYDWSGEQARVLVDEALPAG